MEELDLKMYYKILLKNWIWIVSVVLLTLIVSLVVKLGFTKPPVPEYSTVATIDVSAVVFNDKAVPSISFSEDELENLALNVSKSINSRREDFTITFTNPTPSSINIKIKTEDGNVLEGFTKAIQNDITKKIIKNNQKSPDDTYNKLDDYYKSKIIGTDGAINIEALKLICSDPNKSNELRPVELFAGEKVIAELMNRLTDTNTILTNTKVEETNITTKFNDAIKNITLIDKNINDYTILLNSLLSKQQDQKAQPDTFVSSQIVYIQENLSLLNSYKTYYANAKTQAESELIPVKDLLIKVTRQVEIQTKELYDIKTPLDTKIAFHNSQIELIKLINNIYLDNEALNTKIVSAPIVIKKVIIIDARIRSVIISVWLAFVLMCCMVLLKEYFMIGKKKTNTANRKVLKV